MSEIGVAGVLSTIDEIQPASLLLAKHWQTVYHCQHLTARDETDTSHGRRRWQEYLTTMLRERDFVIFQAAADAVVVLADREARAKTVVPWFGFESMENCPSSNVWLMQVHRRSDSPDAKVDHLNKH